MDVLLAWSVQALLVSAISPAGRWIWTTKPIIKKVGFTNFMERTVRAFKLDDLEDISEDYGQIAVYNGSISGHPHIFDLDDHHRFFTGKPLLVCGNTTSMLSKTRFASAFKVFL